MEGVGGLNYRRQHPVGPYVFDFYCSQAQLAVEVEGQHHGDPEQFEKDEARTAWLAKQDIAVLRIAAERVLH